MGTSGGEAMMDRPETAVKLELRADLRADLRAEPTVPPRLALR